MSYGRESSSQGKGTYKIQSDTAGKLAENGTSVVIPDADDVEAVNSIIFHELCMGKIKDESWKKYLEIIDKMSAKGMQGVILGFTEIGLLIHQEDTSVKLFDTTQIHGEAAAYMSLDRLEKRYK